jgi:Domain of unknown function (DUF2935)
MSTNPASVPPDDPTAGIILTRRHLVEMAGVALVGTALCAAPGLASAGRSAAPRFPTAPIGPVRPESVAGVGVATLAGGMKPVYVARAGSMDPVEHSVADTLFWGEQMMEHAMFFVMLMPGAELAEVRSQAQRHQSRFAAQLAALRRARLDRSNFAAFNRSTLALVRPFVAYKQSMQKAQESGRMRSLVWPQFFEHTRHEAERFAVRLERLSRGDAAFSRAEVVPFWSRIMDEHSLFIAHLLDPEERALIDAARKTSATFRELRSAGAPPAGGSDPVRRAVDDIIDFKTAAERGIQTGQIRSIIHPALADHVRREALRFRDELSRAA